VLRRFTEATIGFAASGMKVETEREALEQVQTRDFIEFGFEPELSGGSRCGWCAAFELG